MTTYLRQGKQSIYHTLKIMLNQFRSIKNIDPKKNSSRSTSNILRTGRKKLLRYNFCLNNLLKHTNMREKICIDFFLLLLCYIAKNLCVCAFSSLNCKKENWKKFNLKNNFFFHSICIFWNVEIFIKLKELFSEKYIYCVPYMWFGL